MKKIVLFLLFFTGAVQAQVVDLSAPTPYRICDAGNNGMETFDLTTKNAEILGSLNPGLFSIAYFNTFTDAINNVSAVPTIYSGVAGEVLYARVWENANTANFDTTPLMLQMATMPTAIITTQDFCLNDYAYISFVGANGVAPYTFTYIINGGPPLTITSSGTSNSASISWQSNVIGTFVFTLVSVSDSSPLTCTTPMSSTVTLNILASPTAYPAPDMIQYDDPYDGFATFDLSAQTPILQGAQTDVTVTYYATLLDADAGANPLPSTSFTNTTNPQTIWAVVQSNATVCRSITSFNVIVAPPVGGDIVFIPDAGFKAKLLAALPTNTTAYGTSGYIKVDANSDGEIQFTEALAVTKLIGSYADVNSFVGLEAFTNLTEFESINNLTLTQLNVSALTSLTKLVVINSKITNLDLSAQTNLTHLDCASGEISYLNFSNSPGLTYLNCSDNELTDLDVSAFTNLTNLNCSQNHFTNPLNLSTLTNLTYLNCNANWLYSLDLTNLTNLTYLNCGGNPLNAINLAPVPNLEELYTVSTYYTTIDVSGLTDLRVLDCSNNQLTALDVSGLTNLELLTCEYNDLAALNVSGCTSMRKIAGKVNYVLPSLDVSGLENLEILEVSFNALTSLNMSGCSNLKKVDCAVNQLAAVDLSTLTSLQVFQCSNNLFTELDFSNSPMTQEYIYDSQPIGHQFSVGNNPNLEYINLKNGTNFWNTPGANTFLPSEVPNLAYICIDEDDYAQLAAFIPATVNVNSYCSFTPGGDYNTIAGMIRFDGNNSGGCDTFDLPQQNIKMNINDGTNQGSTFNNATGNYSFFTENGNFTVTPAIENPTFFSFSPATAVVNFPVVNNSVSTNNFCLSANGIHPDVEVVIAPIIPARPGFDAVYKIVYKNKGNQTLSGSVSFAYDDSVMDFLSAVPTQDNQATGLLTFNYSGLAPFENRQALVTVNINGPMETPAVTIDDVLHFTANVNPVTGDEMPGDNTFEFDQIVIGSYDPNDITCIEGDVVSPSEIGNYLHYVINFENTGTAPAENIIVKLAIDPDQFDIQTLQLLNNSHSVTGRVNADAVEFIFQGIYLETGGHGNILLKIKSDGSLASGDMVTNRADIFFDYNFPVETNPANTVFESLAVGNPDFDNSIVLYPNPAGEFINIKAATAIQSVQVYDIQGRLLQVSARNEQETRIELSGKESGVYFVKVTSEKGIKIEKVIKN